MATYPVHDAYYNNQHVYFWDGDTVVAVPRTPGGNVFRKLFIYFALVAITSTVMKYSDTIAAWANTVYTHWFVEPPVSPLARTLLELLTDPDNWTLDTRDQHLILKGSGVFNLNDNETVVGKPYRIIFYINGDERSNLLSDAEREKVYLAIRVCKQTLMARENQAVADRIALPRRRTSQCNFPNPNSQIITLPFPAAVGVALPTADPKEDPCTEQQPSLRQRSLRPDVGPTR